MADPETLLIEVYVQIDDLVGTTVLLPPRRSGPPPKLTPVETITLGIFSQWSRFRSERDFYGFAERRLRSLFPRLPHRTQFNRQLRRLGDVVAQVALALADSVAPAAYERLDTTAVPTRNVQRRGRGHLAGLTDIGYSPRLHWYEGLHLLLCEEPPGLITGLGVGPASANDRALAETLFAVRAAPDLRLPEVGHPHGQLYLADTGFAGAACQREWAEHYGVRVLAPPQPDSAHRWPPTERQAFARLRQPIESIVHRLLDWFRLGRERPHQLTGLRARLAAKCALNNFCILYNLRHDRPPLKIADILEW
jgi:Transposase DDE domain